ncbi:MAG: hypothetical protein ACYDCF_06370, partial [Burkholderiales bacterium]
IGNMAVALNGFDGFMEITHGFPGNLWVWQIAASVICFLIGAILDYTQNNSRMLGADYRLWSNKPCDLITLAALASLPFPSHNGLVQSALP